MIITGGNVPVRYGNNGVETSVTLSGSGRPSTLVTSTTQQVAFEMTNLKPSTYEYLHISLQSTGVITPAARTSPPLRSSRSGVNGARSNITLNRQRVVRMESDEY